MSNKSIKKMINKARAKDEEQREDARRAIKQKADRFNNTNYASTEEFYPVELSAEDIRKRTCSICGNRYPHELQTTPVEKFYTKGKQVLSYRPPKMTEGRICASPKCRRWVLSDTRVLIHNE